MFNLLHSRLRIEYKCICIAYFVIYNTGFVSIPPIVFNTQLIRYINYLDLSKNGYNYLCKRVNRILYKLTKLHTIRDLLHELTNN